MTQDDSKGFSGLESLLTDSAVDDMLREVGSRSENKPSHSNVSETPETKCTSEEAFFSSKAKGFLWVIGIFVILTVIGLSYSTTESTTYSQPVTSQAIAPLDTAIVQPEIDEVVASAELSSTQTSNVVPNETVTAPFEIEESAAVPQTAAPLFTASFDCAEAKTTLEILICSDADLATLDALVGISYKKAREEAVTNDDLRTSILDEQRRFLDSRLSVCTIPYQANLSAGQAQSIIICLRNLYTERLKGFSENNKQDAEQDQTAQLMVSEITTGVTDFFKKMDGGVVGTTLFINECYQDSLGENPTRSFIYCMAVDTAASKLYPAIEKENNYPMTPFFENYVFQARARQGLAKIGITDPYEQAHAIELVDSTVQDMFNAIAEEGKEGQP